MTREPFIAHSELTNEIYIVIGKEKYRVTEQAIKAVKAIRSLEQEPQSFKWCTDCREYDQEKHCCHRYSKVIRNTVAEIDQEPKTGHWISRPHIYGVAFCSECGFELKINNTNYCPNCGCCMIEPQESEG